ncbi:nuclear transport factor 2 family protein [Cellvibrio sp. OA-2007]|uniref:nuclear transport factor 2 family protein n=1 Tax=Cellvibrio sp. OA-2007 TaxID=529823 RepID=UPI000AF78640|nr:nuclear transport factor 2 family protein [Cellvibrio sp. OA-2007]
MSHSRLSHPVMKKILLIASLCISPLSMADNSEIDVLSKKVEQLRIAMIDGDAKALQQLSSPQLSYGHSGGHIEDQQAFIEKIVSGKSDFVTMELADQTISISGDVALVRHNLNADIKDGGVPNTIHLGVLLVWQKQAGEWKLLARQAFKYPPQAQ